jgi:chromosome segregation ATPase
VKELEGQLTEAAAAVAAAEAATAEADAKVAEGVAEKAAVEATVAELEAEKAAAEARIAELEAKLAQEPPKDTELEAYRRAERAERLARDRANQIYEQANALLAEATSKIEATSDSFSIISAQLAQQLESSKAELQEAVAAMYAIRPTEE